ncbi:MAG: hypothetical protein Q7S18_00740 [bacterium]|nr:hypothetical protein [bacterium]
MPRKIKIAFGFLAVALLSASFFVVRADDEEGNTGASSGKSSGITPVTTTQTSTQTTIIKDSDGDGLIDSEDPHPNIPEIYIVEDNNLNGIVDKFENGK